MLTQLHELLMATSFTQSEKSSLYKDSHEDIRGIYSLGEASNNITRLTHKSSVNYDIQTDDQQYGLKDILPSIRGSML